MFINWYDKSVRLTGRWSRNYAPRFDYRIFNQPTTAYTTTTAAGSYFELAFTGDCARLHFDLGYLAQPFPHLYISVDGGARIEVPVDRYLRIEAEEYGTHIIKVIYKGGMEQLPRWYSPLMGAISFIGAEVDAPAELPEDNRRIIEFVGDSITEGVLTDADYAPTPAHTLDQHCRPYQDDNCATYASLTAKRLNLRPIYQAYGAVGLTRAGCGSVPRAGLIYPYCYDGVPYTGEKPDVILINHGANDRGNRDRYPAEYRALLALLREKNPAAKIVVLTPFCGAFDDVLPVLVDEFNRETGDSVVCISSAGWVPAEPLHPLRDGHEIIAEKFAAELAKILA